MKRSASKFFRYIREIVKYTQCIVSAAYFHNGSRHLLILRFIHIFFAENHRRRTASCDKLHSLIEISGTEFSVRHTNNIRHTSNHSAQAAVPHPPCLRTSCRCSCHRLFRTAHLPACLQPPFRCTCFRDPLCRWILRQTL